MSANICISLCPQVRTFDLVLSYLRATVGLCPEVKITQDAFRKMDRGGGCQFRLCQDGDCEVPPRRDQWWQGTAAPSGSLWRCVGAPELRGCWKILADADHVSRRKNLRPGRTNMPQQDSRALTLQTLLK